MIMIKISTFLLLMLIILCLGVVVGVAISFIGNEQRKENEEKGDGKQ